MTLHTQKTLTSNLKRLYSGFLYWYIATYIILRVIVSFANYLFLSAKELGSRRKGAFGRGNIFMEQMTEVVWASANWFLSGKIWMINVFGGSGNWTCDPLLASQFLYQNTSLFALIKDELIEEVKILILHKKIEM